MFFPVLPVKIRNPNLGNGFRFERPAMDGQFFDDKIAHPVVKRGHKGEPAGDNPWEGSTLEWSIASPPPHYNFRVLPRVSGRDPLWAEDTSAAAPGDDPSVPEPHMPGPSYYPFVTSVGIVVMAGGGLTLTLPVVFLGVALILFGIYGWALQPLEH